MRLGNKLTVLLCLCAAVALVVIGVRLIRAPHQTDSSGVATHTDAFNDTTTYNRHQKQNGYRKRYTPRSTGRYAYTRQGTRPVVEINSADSATLVAVRGIGPVFARRIISFRERMGGLRSKDELLMIRGIDSAVLQQIAPQLRIDSTRCTKFQIATCDERTIREHPRLNRSLSTRIIQHRAAHPSTEALLRANIILPSEARILHQYFR